MREFYEEVRERKSLVPSARRIKNGSKTSYVSLPNDNLTNGAWKKMNGRAETYNLREPMKWDRFKSMPTDLQEEYINYLRNEFSATCAGIAKGLGVSRGYLKDYLDSHNIHVVFKGRTSSENMKRLADFFGYPHETEVAVEDAVKEDSVSEDVKIDKPERVAVAVPVAATEEAPEISPMRMDNCIFKFSGAFSANRLLLALTNILEEGVPYSIEICVSQEG